MSPYQRQQIIKVLNEGLSFDASFIFTLLFESSIDHKLILPIARRILGAYQPTNARMFVEELQLYLGRFEVEYVGTSSVALQELADLAEGFLMTELALIRDELFDLL
jgi:hypothetical protein